MSWTLKQLAHWCGGAVQPEFENVEITAITTDSKKAAKGSLFVALIGEKHNAHKFIPDALKAGASAVLVSEPQDAAIAQIVVDNTHDAYGALAAGYRTALEPVVVGITGSVGKTTTKEMTYAVLNTTYKTQKSEGNHNNDIGVPMSILELQEDTQYAVLEMGMNHFGEMAYLTSISRPNISVITNIGTSHIEYLGSRDGILQAKMEIVQGMSKKDVLVLNGDEPLLWNQREQSKLKTYFFGVENPLCDVLAEDIQQLDGGMSFRVRGMGHQFEIFLPTDGIHAVYDALAAVTVGILCRVKPERMQQALSRFRNTGMRQEVSTVGNVTLIADCYNASPESMDAELNVLGSWNCTGRRIAVLGDMLELGNRSMAEHYRIGRIAAQKADMVYTYGSYTKRLLTGCITGGMASENCRHFETHEDLARALDAIVKDGDVLLFKGSRGMKMENALELLREKLKERQEKSV